MLITRGASLPRRCGRAARVHRIWANSLTSVSASQSASDSVANRPGRAAPALLTRMSTPPSAAAAAATNDSTCPGSVTSQGSATIFPPRAASSAATSPRSASLREQMTTSAPSASSSAAIALPSPLVPPVTIARRPVRPRSIPGSPVRSGRGSAGLLPGQGEQALARRAEHVHLAAGRVRRPGRVRYPGRYDSDIAWPHHPHVAVQVEGQLTLQHDDDLLLLVHVPGRLHAGLEAHEVRHHPLPEHRPETQPWHELGRRDVIQMHIPARPRGLAQRLGAEMAGHVAHRSSLAGPSTAAAIRPASLRTPSSMRSSFTRL